MFQPRLTPQYSVPKNAKVAMVNNTYNIIISNFFSLRTRNNITAEAADFFISWIVAKLFGFIIFQLTGIGSKATASMMAKNYQHIRTFSNSIFLSAKPIEMKILFVLGLNIICRSLCDE